MGSSDVTVCFKNGEGTSKPAVHLFRECDTVRIRFPHTIVDDSRNFANIWM